MDYCVHFDSLKKNKKITVLSYPEKSQKQPCTLRVYGDDIEV